MIKCRKYMIKMLLTGMVILNILMAFFVLIPSNTAQGASLNSASQSQPQISAVQHFRIVDQAMQKFWTNLLPFWDG